MTSDPVSDPGQGRRLPRRDFIAGGSAIVAATFYGLPAAWSQIGLQESGPASVGYVVGSSSYESLKEPPWNGDEIGKEHALRVVPAARVSASRPVRGVALIRVHELLAPDEDRLPNGLRSLHLRGPASARSQDAYPVHLWSAGMDPAFDTSASSTFRAPSRSVTLEIVLETYGATSRRIATLAVRGGSLERGFYLIGLGARTWGAASTVHPRHLTARRSSLVVSVEAA